MILHLIVAREGRHDRPRVHLEREVPWPCCPPDGYTVFVGREEDGEGSSINAKVAGSYFSTDGVVVGAEVEHCRQEYEDILAAVGRDGFIVKHVFE